MDVAFTIGNKVYDSATATVTFNDKPGEDFPTATSGNTVKCWVIDAIMLSTGTYTSCAVSTRIATISNIKESAANTQFKFRVLVLFDSGANNDSQLTKIDTKDSANNVIDETVTGSPLAKFTRGTFTNQASTSG